MLDQRGGKLKEGVIMSGDDNEENIPNSMIPIKDRQCREENECRHDHNSYAFDIRVNQGPATCKHQRRDRYVRLY